jgi:hypothetical protein
VVANKWLLVQEIKEKIIGKIVALKNLINLQAQYR